MFALYRTAKLLFVSSLLLFLLGCHRQPAHEDRAPYVKYYKEIVGDFAQKTKTSYNLRCIAEGGQMPYDVEKVELGFISYQRASIEEARKLEVLVSEDLARAINAHQKIRPYLREYPFPASRTNISISFNKPDNRQYTDGSVALIFHVRDKVFYCAEDPETGKYIDIHEESYDEARRIVLGEAQ